MLSTPVVLFGFNRPDLTRRTLAAIRDAAPEQLFLVADGPRADHPEDAALCAATRDELELGDYPGTVHRRYADGNLGLEASVELGLDWVFDRVDRAIVFEDDCVPDPSFFPYCEELLDRYAGDGRVWQLSGNNHGASARVFAGDSYAFTSWASVWGWATWADRWCRHREVFPRDHAEGDAPVRRRPARPGAGALVTGGGRRHFAAAAVSDDTVTFGWDTHWWLTVMTEGGLCVTPSANIVENVGWGADATHGVSARSSDHPAHPMAFPLRHPGAVELHVEAERELELALSRQGGRAARMARRVVRSPALRRAARSVVHSRPATGAARAASRLGGRRR